MIFNTVQNAKKLHPAGLKNTAISQSIHNKNYQNIARKIDQYGKSKPQSSLQSNLNNLECSVTYSKLLSTVFYMLQQFLTTILQFTLPFYFCY